MDRQTGEAMARLGVTIRPSAEVFTLSGGQRQSAAVARAAMWATSAIFMDEPTANLGVRQTKGVLDLIRRVRDAGTAVVIISHNLPQILEITDRICHSAPGPDGRAGRSFRASVDDLIRAMMSGVLRSQVDMSGPANQLEDLRPRPELPRDERTSGARWAARSIFEQPVDDALPCSYSYCFGRVLLGTTPGCVPHARQRDEHGHERLHASGSGGWKHVRYSDRWDRLVHQRRTCLLWSHRRDGHGRRRGR